jgi:hypothetical protein
MTDCCLVDTPMVINIELVTDLSVAMFPYHRLVGMLLYLAHAS